MAKMVRPFQFAQTSAPCRTVSPLVGKCPKVNTFCSFKRFAACTDHFFVVLFVSCVANRITPFAFNCLPSPVTTLISLSNNKKVLSPPPLKHCQSPIPPLSTNQTICPPPTRPTSFATAICLPSASVPFVLNTCRPSNPLRTTSAVKTMLTNIRLNE